MKFRIKRGDTVQVIAGKDKGRIGRVLAVYPARHRVLVEGVNIVQRHRKPQGEQAGRIDRVEAPIHISNVAYWDVERSCRVKIGYRRDEQGRKVRVDRKTGQPLDRQDGEGRRS